MGADAVGSTAQGSCWEAPPRAEENYLSLMA